MKESYGIKFIDNSLNLKIKQLNSGTNEDKELYRLIKRSINKIKENPFNSIIVKKNQIPKIYVKKYQITNLRILKLNQNWRLIYTITSNEIQIISIVLEILNHKNYEKRFNYKTK